MIVASMCQFYETFSSSLQMCQNKLERLCLAILFRPILYLHARLRSYLLDYFTMSHFNIRALTFACKYWIKLEMKYS